MQNTTCTQTGSAFSTYCFRHITFLRQGRCSLSLYLVSIIFAIFSFIKYTFSALLCDLLSKNECKRYFIKYLETFRSTNHFVNCWRRNKKPSFCSFAVTTKILVETWWMASCILTMNSILFLLSACKTFQIHCCKDIPAKKACDIIPVIKYFKRTISMHLSSIIVSWVVISHIIAEDI